MSEQENIAIVRAAYDAFGRGDIDGVIALCATDIDWISPGPPELPTAGGRRGHADVRRFFAAVNELYTFERFDPQRFLADGDQVVVLGEDTVTVKATGKTITEGWAHVFDVANGKVTRFQEYIDTAAIVAELRQARAQA
jgi:ketosteroid isomerase-like protein